MNFPIVTCDHELPPADGRGYARACPERPQAAGLVPSINKGKKEDEGKGEVRIIDKRVARYKRLRKNLGVAAKLLANGPGVAHMLTFTYSDEIEWSSGHVKEAIRHLRSWLDRSHDWTLRYLWVIETKARQSGLRIGEMRPHYHAVVWVPNELPLDALKLDARGWWPYGWTNVVKANAPISYVMKYVSKFDEPDAFPRGARSHGIGGLDKDGRRSRRWINLPKFVQARSAIHDPWQRARGGGWIDPDGEVWPSEWGMHRTDKVFSLLVRLRTYPTPIHAGREFKPDGPFSWLPSSGETE